LQYFPVLARFRALGSADTHLPGSVRVTRTGSRESKMRGPAVCLCLGLGALVPACGPHVSPDEVMAPPAAEWWLGDWVVDLAALDHVESFRRLPPEAQETARALISGARWRLAFDSRRVHLPDGRLVPFSLSRGDAQGAELALATGERLTLTRTGGGLFLSTHDLPLRRAD